MLFFGLALHQYVRFVYEEQKSYNSYMHEPSNHAEEILSMPFHFGVILAAAFMGYRYFAPELALAHKDSELEEVRAVNDNSSDDDRRMWQNAEYREEDVSDGVGSPYGMDGGPSATNAWDMFVESDVGDVGGFCDFPHHSQNKCNKVVALEPGSSPDNEHFLIYQTPKKGSGNILYESDSSKKATNLLQNGWSGNSEETLEMLETAFYSPNSRKLWRNELKVLGDSSAVDSSVVGANNER